MVENKDKFCDATDNSKLGKDFPQGTRFLKWMLQFENVCITATHQLSQDLGRKVPLCHENLGNLLSRLYREACCGYGCAGGDHFGERMAGRVVSHALGSYRLLCAGYYDESLALSRNLGEAANLFWWFLFCPPALEEWRKSDRKTRQQTFSPVKVRLALEKEGIQVPIDSERYSSLCEVAVHITPQTVPQGHSLHGRPSLGAWFQPDSFMASLNELAGATGICAGALALMPLLTLDESRKRSLAEASVALLEAVGGVDLGRLRELRTDQGGPVGTTGKVSPGRPHV